MSDADRAAKAKDKPKDKASEPRPGPSPTPAVQRAQSGPAWLGGYSGAPLGLAGVQRKVSIGSVGDPFECQAEQVAERVASGGGVAPDSIARVAPGSFGVGQRAVEIEDAKPEERRPETSPGTPTVQKAEKVREKGEAPEKSLEEKVKEAPIQRTEQPAAAATPAKPPKKEEPKTKAPPVQKAEKVREKGEAPEKSLEEKVKEAPVQRAAAAASKAADAGGPEKKPKEGAVQRATAGPAPKPAGPMPPPEKKPKDATVQRAAAGSKAPAPAAEKERKPEPSPPALQKAAAADSKERKEKPPPPSGSPPIQKATKQEDPHRKQPKEEPPKHALPLQRAPAPSGASSSAMEDAADHAIQRKGPGEPLPGATRDRLEHGMRVDLDDVRVHHDGAARDAARDLNARAFTHGSDIWLGHGESAQNVGLMAHEATHVVQQTGAVQRMLVQRADKKGGPAPGAKPATAAEDAGPWDYEGKEGKVRKGSKLVIPKIKVPKFKKKLTSTPLTLPKKTDEPRPDTQRKIWEDEVKKSKGIDAKLDKKLTDDKAPPMEEGGEPLYFLKLKSQDVYVIGNRETVKGRLLRPYWDKSGKPESFQVDHRHELQLGGGEGPENLWLLDAEANMASGRVIRDEKNDAIQRLIDAAQSPKNKDGPTWKGEAPTVDAVRKSYTIVIEDVQGADIGEAPKATWDLDEVADKGLQVDALKALTKQEIDERGLRGSPSEIVVYTNASGGGKRSAKPWRKDVKQKDVKWRFGKLLQVDTLTYDSQGKKGSIHVSAYKNNPLLEEVEADFDLVPHEAVEYGGYVSSGAVTRAIQIRLKALSPVTIEYAELTERGLVGRGKVKPGIRLLEKAELDLILDGDNIYVSKIFSAEDFSFPGPIKVTGASLEIFAGTQGLGAQGDVLFEIERVGKGKLSGKASSRGGFAISGAFEFDTKLFDPAKIHAEYADGKFKATGEIGIPANRVKGIRSANLKVTVDDGALDAKGSVKPAIPGIEQADLSVTQSPTEGLVIAGHLELKKDIPGIAGGSVDATVVKKPGAEDYKVSAKGTATPKIPGISAQIGVSYDDGAFDIVGTVGYEKGMLKGAVTVGATNRPVSAEGAPAGEPPGTAADKITLYGGGMLALRLAPWLEARATVRLLPNGEIEVTGRIGLPDTLELFKEKKLDKNIFTVGIDIPIVGVSVLGQRIGIFANISGGLDLGAGIGPGQLQDLHLEVTYNPAHEEETHVVGAAALHIPARAGLRLFVRGSLGVGIPVVSASAGLEIGGSLGLEGALDAAVNVDWTPVRGLDITASAEIFVEPKLKFDITGFVLVEADLVFSTIELYSKRWQLAAVEYGSGLRFGLKLPIHYQEGKPFDLSFSDVEFIVPDISAGDVLSGLIKKIA